MRLTSALNLALGASNLALGAILFLRPPALAPGVRSAEHGRLPTGSQPAPPSFTLREKAILTDIAVTKTDKASASIERIKQFTARRYSHLTRRLATHQINLARVNELLIDRELRLNDVRDVLLSHGEINPDPKFFIAACNAATSETDALISAALDDDGRKIFESFLRYPAEYFLLGDLTDKLSYSQAPLTGAQIRAMDEVLKNAASADEVHEAVRKVLLPPQLPAFDQTLRRETLMNEMKEMRLAIFNETHGNG